MDNKITRCTVCGKKLNREQHNRTIYCNQNHMILDAELKMTAARWKAGFRTPEQKMMEIR